MNGVHRSQGAVLFARAGPSQVKLATNLGVSMGAIAMWQTGQRVPGLPNRKLLLEKFKIPIESWDQESEPPSSAHEPSSVRLKEWGDSTTLSRVERLQRIVDRELDRIETDAEMTPKERSQVTANLARTIEQLRRMTGEDVAEVKVLSHPKWHELRDIVLEELSDDPERMKRILERLDRDDRG